MIFDIIDASNDKRFLYSLKMQNDNIKEAAKRFAQFWSQQRGSEKGEDQTFWNSLLSEVMGIADIKWFIKYQEPVHYKGTTKFLDAWIPTTRVLIEHKTRGVDLDQPQLGHDGQTPFQQAWDYDNFPWPENSVGKTGLTCFPTLKEKIAATAQAILDARARYPDSSLADLYDPLTMPPELRKAHRDNDRAVLAAYGLPESISESEIVSHLFDRYARLVGNAESSASK